MTRRAFLLAPAFWDAARRKAESEPWARAALAKLLAAAEADLRSPVSIPDRGGQWPHWYSCPRDGVRLTTVSPTEHRCSRCGAVYHGDPYDAVVVYGVHANNSRAMRRLALAWRFTGRADFAARAGRLLAGYADRYRGYRLHNVRDEEKAGGGRVMAQSLDESVWLIPVAEAYTLVRETLSADQCRHVETNLLLPAAEVIRSHRMGIHNIQCWKNSAVGLVGFAVGNDELVREAIDDPERGFRAQIARGVTDDGLWFEGSLGYHQYTMQALWPLAEAARQAGINLYSERYRKLYEAPLALALPDGAAPGFNDSSGGSVHAMASLYELAWSRWKTPAFGHLVAASPRDSIEALLYGAAQAPAGPVVPTVSSLLPAAGFAVLRSPSASVAVRFGMHGGGHGHPDKLNIVTYGAGRRWGLDPGSIAYGVPLHREWYRTTIAHNTVTVDQASQANADGQLDRWDTSGGATTLEASAGEVYPGAVLRRILTLRGNRLLDRFECRSESEHTWDWAFHAEGKLTVSAPLESREERLGAGAGYQHIARLAAGSTGSAFRARWERDGVVLTLAFEGAPGTGIFTGEGPGSDPAVAVPVLVVRRRGRQAVFAVEHQFGS